MKKLLIYPRVIGASPAVLPPQAEAGSREKKKCGHSEGRHGYYPGVYFD